MAENDTEKTGPDLGSEPSESGDELTLERFEKKKTEFCRKCGFNSDQVNLKLTRRPDKDTHYGMLQIEGASRDGGTCVLNLAPGTTAELDVQATEILDQKITSTEKLMEPLTDLLKDHLKEKVLQEKGLLEDKAVYTNCENGSFYIKIGEKTPEDRFELRYVGFGPELKDAVKMLEKAWEI